LGHPRLHAVFLAKKQIAPKPCGLNNNHFFKIEQLESDVAWAILARVCHMTSVDVLAVFCILKADLGLGSLLQGHSHGCRLLSLTR
jgi:hypothetical protein